MVSEVWVWWLRRENRASQHSLLLHCLQVGRSDLTLSSWETQLEVAKDIMPVYETIPPLNK